MIAETMDRWTREWFQQGREEGLKEGLKRGSKQGLKEQKALLRQLTERKFGPGAAEELDRVLEGTTNPERMRAAAVAIVDCETGEELLDRVR